MSAPRAYETLRTKLGEIHDIVKSASLLGWDQQVLMPSRGGEARAHQLGTLGKLAHELFVSDEIGSLLEELRSYEESLDYDSLDASLIRVARRDYEKAVRVPPELSAEITRVGAQSFGVWVEARANSDYESFRPWLERLVELKHRYVECYPPADELYDTLLDDYEPGMKAADVRAIFDRLKEVLIPLVEAAAPAATPQVIGTFPAEIQRRLSLEIVKRFGFDETGWRLDTAPHPFAQSLATQDIRITTREPEDSLDGLFATMHECGHGLYEAGVDPAFERTLLARGASLGLHESQSRLWENLVGRSRPFWSWFYPRLQETFPAELGSVDEETWFRSINDVRPGLIRIEADEASYNLHIILRFELEQRIMDGLDLRELPDIWNESMAHYLGVDVPNDAQGVLQDVHWSRGGFGYFPTYSLGNVISVQIWERLRDDLDDVDGQIARGEFAEIREWLRENVHRHGRKFTPVETLERAVGGAIDAEPYLAYLQGKLAVA
ncbi:MAG: carboxypeptidase M32 [Gaiellaceae bacterium]